MSEEQAHYATQCSQDFCPTCNLVTLYNFWNTIIIHSPLVIFVHSLVQAAIEFVYDSLSMPVAASGARSRLQTALQASAGESHALPLSGGGGNEDRLDRR